MKASSIPPRPNTYPSLPMKIVSLAPETKQAAIKYLGDRISSLQKEVGNLTGKVASKGFWNTRFRTGKDVKRKVTKSVPISTFARRFSTGRMPWQNRARKIQKEIDYLEWQRSQWRKAKTSSETPQLLPQVPEKVFRKRKINTLNRKKAIVPREERTLVRQYSKNNASMFPRGMKYNDAKALYRKLMLKYHPNKGGTVAMSQKVSQEYERYLTEYNIHNSYEEGLRLLTLKPTKQMPLEKILHTTSNIIMSGLFLSEKVTLPTYKFELLRLRQISYAETHGIETHTRKMMSVLDKIDALGDKQTWTVKSVLQGLIGIPKDKKIPRLQKKLRQLNRLIASVKRVKPTFILRRNGQDVLIDQVYLDALVADLTAMMLATTTALLDARKAMKHQTNKKIKKIVEEGHLAKNDLVQWFRNNSGSGTGQYGTLLMSTAPVQYMIQSLPTTLIQNNQGEKFILPQQQGRVLNQAYDVVTGFTTFVALGLLHRLRRRVRI